MWSNRTRVIGTGTLLRNHVHHLPGRLRIRLLALKGAPAAAGRVQSTLAAIDGISACTVSAVTGSVLVNYEPMVANLEQLAATLRNLGYEFGDLPPPLPGGRALHPGLEIDFTDMGRQLGKMALTVALEKALERSAVALIAALI